jgi:hypothetical protein
LSGLVLVLVLLLAAPTTQAKKPAGSRPPDAGSLEAEGPYKPPPPFRWNLSNIVREAPIDGVQMVNDVPVRLHSVVVKGRVEAVLQEIYNGFLKAGLYIERPENQDQFFRQTQLTALDTERAISYTAMVDGLADGTCVVVLGEANIGESTRVGLLRKNANAPEATDFAPLMPTALTPTRVNIEGMRTLGFSVVASSEADVRKFYQEQLKKRGYLEAPGDLFQRKQEEIQLSMQRDKERLNVLLTLRPKLDAVTP